jgi:hypothetical protein
MLTTCRGMASPLCSDISLTVNCRAAWAGTRIILRQVSPEANGIFDLIIALHHACDGQWEALSQRTGVGMPDIDRFLGYAATFLSNVGNYFVRTLYNISSTCY